MLKFFCLFRCLMVCGVVAWGACTMTGTFMKVRSHRAMLLSNLISVYAFYGFNQRQAKIDRAWRSGLNCRLPALAEGKQLPVTPIKISLYRGGVFKKPC